jgi:hypothetical protein
LLRLGLLRRALLRVEVGRRQGNGADRQPAPAPPTRYCESAPIPHSLYEGIRFTSRPFAAFTLVPGPSRKAHSQRLRPIRKSFNLGNLPSIY